MVPASQFDSKAERAIARKVESWVDRVVSGSVFPDARLGKRFRTLLERVGNAMGGSIPLVCQDWANTKAAYRFFANDRVGEDDIFAGHLQSTSERVAATDGLVLMLQDTTEFTYQRERPDAIGLTYSVNSGRDKAGRVRAHSVSGILMHSSLAVTIEGLPLGLAAVKFWTNKKFRGTAALKKKVNPTRVPIEKKESFRWLENLRQSNAPARCVHIGDRESDIYELFCTAQEIGTQFLVRTCVDRLAGDGDLKIADEIGEVEAKGQHRIQVQDNNGNPSEVVLDLKYRRIRVLPPIGKQKHYPALTLTVLCAQERGVPKNRKMIDWKLITDLPVRSRAEAVAKLDWYALRWKIEVFHKILKSGCKVEEARLRTADRLVNLISVCCILSWRLFWMTMLRRSAHEAPPGLGLTDGEIELIDRLQRDTQQKASRPKALAHYIIKIAKLGGYLARASDPPPGTMVIWRGLSRLADIELGTMFSTRDVGN